MNRASLLGTMGLLLIAACGADTHEQGVGGETNWLDACESDATCTGAARCVCGVCSDDCERDSECGEGIECRGRDSALVIEACGTQSEHGLCAPRDSAPEDSGAPDVSDASDASDASVSPDAGRADSGTFDAGPRPSLCSEPRDEGSCSEVVPSYYYDWEMGSCRSFDYSGCNGNQNRFDSMAECMETCERPPELVQTIDGLLTCRESYLALQDAIEALRLTHAECELDEDCTCTTVSHDCGSDCSAPIRAADEAVFQAELEVVAGGYCSDEGRPAKCGTYDEDCGCAAGCVDSVCSYVALTSER